MSKRINFIVTLLAVGQPTSFTYCESAFCKQNASRARS
jgi:hypothetical protein